MTLRSPQVAVVQKTLLHYRVEFYEGLRQRLADHEVGLRLLVGQPNEELALRRDTGNIVWSESIRNRYVQILGRTLIWQPCLTALGSCDLVIVEQASKLLVNYPLLSWRRLGGPRVAWWGHGLNLDIGSSSRLGESVKRRLARRADWWFCYTEGTARLVEGLGVSPSRITVVQNAPDTNQVRQLRSEISDPQLFCAREELGVGDGPVGLYVGSLYTAKRIPYLIEACDQLRTRLPDFHLIVIGDGPDRRFLNAAASTRPWVHVLGMRTRVEMVRYAALASIVLNPGLVGLSVLDAFALGLPMVTCDLTYHSPEIEYLKHGDNGLVLATETSAAAYGDAVATLLTNTAMLRRLSSGARLSAEVFTVEEMIERFAAGILTCLETPR